MNIDNHNVELNAPGGLGSLYSHFKKDWLRCLLLALVGLAVRAPALQGQIIWDDQYLARDNPFIKSPLFVLEVFRHYLFLDSFSPHYRPVQNLSLILDYTLWNKETFGFHLTNVLIHVAGGILLYFLLRRLFQSLHLQIAKIDNSLVAFLVAAIWIVHPVHSAAVDYISGRADSLAFSFACGGWLLFLKAGEIRNWALRVSAYMASAIAGLTALCSRESAGIWFALFIVHLLATKETEKKTKWFATVACCIVISIYAGLRQLPEHHAERNPAGPSAPVRAVLMLRALGDYSRLMLFPVNLHMERTVFEPTEFRNTPLREEFIEFEYLSVLGIAAAIAIAVLGFRGGNARPLRLFGASWFVIGFLPVSNLFNLNASVAEHWLYLPSVGFIIFVAGCALDLPARFRHVTIAVASVAILALGVRSFIRSTDWVDPETFFQRTANAGGTGSRIGVNLGQTYALQGKYDKAEVVFRNVLKKQPDYTIARNNLADTLTRLGKEDEAKAVLADATAAAHTSMKDYPRTWVAALNYAHLLSRNHDSAGALAVLERARKDYPKTWELIAAEGEIFRNQNDLDRAIGLIRPYAEKNWWHYGAWMALGQLFAEKADVDLAEAALLHASLLDIHSTEALNLVAIMRMGENRLDDACRAQRRAVSREPDQPRQYVLLSNILEKMGRDDEARSALAQVSKLRSLAESKSN